MNHQRDSFVGVDPGFAGAIALINGGVPMIWDMPVRTAKLDRKRELDLGRLWVIIRQFKQDLDAPLVGLEWPTTRPGEGAERAKRFGVQMGQLEALLYAARLDYERVPPATWKGHLCVTGKTQDNWEQISIDLFTTYYPEYTELIYGPQGGLKDGRLDALLIAHYMRVNTLSGIAGVVEEHGKGSVQAEALMLGGGRQGKKKMRGV